MSKDFAAKVLDTIYAKAQPHGGECFISARQYEVLSEYLTFEWCDPTCTRSRAYGNLGKYTVDLICELGECVCTSITPRDEAEVEAEERAEAERKAQVESLRSGYANGQYIGQPKQRLTLNLRLVSERCFEGRYGTRFVYEFANVEDGSCVVWFASKVLEWHDEANEQWVYAEAGDTVTMKATVKEHGEYRGTKQTVINRPKVLAIA